MVIQFSVYITFWFHIFHPSPPSSLDLFVLVFLLRQWLRLSPFLKFLTDCHNLRCVFSLSYFFRINLIVTSLETIGNGFSKVTSSPLLSVQGYSPPHLHSIPPLRYSHHQLSSLSTIGCLRPLFKRGTPSTHYSVVLV